jgi:TatD DNase family protein
MQCTIADVVERAKQSQVTHLLNVGTTLEDVPSFFELIKPFPNVRGSIGLHPNEQPGFVPEVDDLKKLITQHGAVAIGETGLDYYRTEEDNTWQHERFRRHIAVAKELKLPLIIHTREAKKDTIQILKEEGADSIGGVMHCFTEDWEMAKAAMDLNFVISFSGIVTFKNATQIQEVALKIAADKMLIETDCPYLAPIPHRGKINEPAFVRHVAEFIAQMRGDSVENIGQNTTDNFFRLFSQFPR